MIWRLLAQLSDLMPYLVRLVPMLERFGIAGVQQVELTGIEKGVGELKDSHHSLLTQLQDHNVRLAAIEGKLEQMQMQSSRLEEQLGSLAEAIQSSQRRLALLLGLTILLLLAGLGVTAFLLFFHR